ncbi:hypothetical protein ACET3X_002052 [Alternaria dauci]|uniref:Uncharacterized protein n=1 Tax=Alternaria dauci TaxID=48095 RepID=A0ABR3UZW5_9PLEO
MITPRNSSLEIRLFQPMSGCLQYSSLRILPPHARQDTGEPSSAVADRGDKAPILRLPTVQTLVKVRSVVRALAARHGPHTLNLI